MLAVIVILAVIGLVTTPLILNMIENSKKEAYRNNANALYRIGETKYVTDYSLNQEFKEVTYLSNQKEFTTSGGDKLNYKGGVPEEGIVQILVQGKVNVVLYNEGYCAYRSNDMKDAKV